MKNILFRFAGILTVFSMTFGTVFATPTNNIPICHATSSEQNPYNVLYVNPNGWSGHDDHDGDFIITDLNNDQVINDFDCLLYDNGDDDEGEDPVCVEGDLVVNGGFEAPVAPNGGWDEYDSGTPGLGWDVAWNGVFAGAPEVAKLELHNGVNGWVSHEGEQHAELDADWGYASNEQASVGIWQTLNTVDGVSYDLSYAFSPRPNTGAGENILEVYLNGVLMVTHGPVAGVANTLWSEYSLSFEGTGSDVIEFRDAGTPNTLGTFLDDVSVTCEGEPEVCYEVTPLYARINFSKIVKGNPSSILGWRNWGAGNMNPKVYVGGNTEDNVYEDGEWFPLTNPDGTFINDPDIVSYRDVPGLAVQRMNGSIRVVMYAFHESSAVGKELAKGSIELSTDMSTRLTGAWVKGNGFIDPIDNNPHTGLRLHDASVNDAQNPMDSRDGFNGYIHQYDVRFDNVRVNLDLFQFHLVADTGSDGFYADYDFDSTEEVDCEQEEQYPQ